MNKIYFLLAIFVLPVLLFSTTWYVDGTVPASGSGTEQSPFKTINEGITASSESDIVVVCPTTYNEYVLISGETRDNLLLCSKYYYTGDDYYIESTIINGNESHKGIKISRPDNIEINGLSILDCRTDSGTLAAGITISDHSDNTIISNCIVKNCINYGDGGGGIRISYSQSCIIESCLIEENANDQDNGASSDWNFAGGIYICGGASIYGPFVDNCIVRNNNGGGIEIYTMPTTADLLTVQNTLISDNYTGLDGAGIDLNYSSLEMENCTIVNNVHGENNYKVGISQCVTPNTYNYKTIKNSIILNTSHFYDDDVITYCGHLDDDDMEPNSNNGSTGNEEITASETFVSGDLLYHLKWNSVCVDLGDPDNDGNTEDWIFDEDDQDADGSRLSIGYIPYEELDRWEFEDEDIVWMSFPKFPCADGVNNGDQILGSAVFSRFLETTQPNIEVWKKRDLGLTPSFTGVYNYPVYTWTQANFEFNSTEGLKIKVNDDFDPINPLISGGLLCEPGTQLTVTTGANDLNWVGYYLPKTMNIMSVLNEDTKDKLTSIKAHDWSLYKRGDQWYGNCPFGGTTVSYGDMVELRTNETTDFTFRWVSFGTASDAYERKETQYFTYKEELDYQSIFVELGEEKPAEIAVYVDGVCKGAEVVDVDSLLEIRAYLLEEAQGQEIEIVTASGRSNPVKMDYHVVEDDGKLLDRSLFTDRSKMYQIISLEAGEEVPEPVKVLTCYPNPFNPELTIAFFTTESTESTEINIFNLKGQRVKTLVDAKLTAGEHSVVWQGRNDAGNQVSSGVYFIRMQVGNEVFIGKAVLMK